MDRFHNTRLLKEAAITPELLQRLLHYDPVTGSITWKVSRGNKRAGTTAGYIDEDGYWRIMINKSLCRGHRIAWAMMTGAWPEELIDHENGKRFDNRWKNLRSASHAFNQQNKTKCAAKSGLMGVQQRGKRFRAQITIKGVSRLLGTFKTAEEAHMAYLAAKQIHHPHAYIASL